MLGRRHRGSHERADAMQLLKEQDSPIRFPFCFLSPHKTNQTTQNEKADDPKVNKFSSCSHAVVWVYMVDYIDRFSNVEPFLHPWDEAYLIMIDDFSDVFLDLICLYFIEYFCFNIHEDIGL
ncbi:hypothetical protein H671_6g16399 [Cricetulus griseus]|nr:hypothetical protein H671_6g16399 [Cricetulus griseus]